MLLYPAWPSWKINKPKIKFTDWKFSVWKNTPFQFADWSPNMLGAASPWVCSKFGAENFLLKFDLSVEAKAQIANHRKTAIRLLGGIVNWFLEMTR